MNIDGDERAFIAEAATKLYANLSALQAGFEGKPVSVHAFDAVQSRKIAKRMVGRMLSQREAAALLKAIG